MPARLSRTKGWQVLAVHWQQRHTIPVCPLIPPSQALALHEHHRLHRLRPPEHKSQWQNPALIDPKINFTWVKASIR